MDAKTITETLNSIAQGDGAAVDRLVPVVYREMRRLAVSPEAAVQPRSGVDPKGMVLPVSRR